MLVVVVVVVVVAGPTLLAMRWSYMLWLYDDMIMNMQKTQTYEGKEEWEFGLAPYGCSIHKEVDIECGTLPLKCPWHGSPHPRSPWPENSYSNLPYIYIYI